jgi:hypothetical protein
LKWDKVKYYTAENIHWHLLKLSSKLQDSLDFKKNNQCASTWLLKFATEAMSARQMFLGLIQTCDVICSNSAALVTHISNVSWVLTLHTVLEVTPNKIVRWSRFGWNGDQAMVPSGPLDTSLRRSLTKTTRFYSRFILVTLWNDANHWTCCAFCCVADAILKCIQKWRLCGTALQWRIYLQNLILSHARKLLELPCAEQLNNNGLLSCQLKRITKL